MTPEPSQSGRSIGGSEGGGEGLLESVRQVLGIEFTWDDWDHAVGFVVFEEQEQRNELARMVVDEQIGSMEKMEKLLSTLRQTDKRYLSDHEESTVTGTTEMHASRDRRRMRRMVRWRNDNSEIASVNWHKVLRDLTTERGLWGGQQQQQQQGEEKAVEEGVSGGGAAEVFWKITSTEDNHGRRRLLVRNYLGTDHKGRLQKVSKADRADQLRADRLKTEHGMGEGKGLWQELMAASALRLPTLTKEESEVGEHKGKEEETNTPVGQAGNVAAGAASTQQQTAEEQHENVPLLSLPCDLIMPMLELEATIELYRTSIWVIVGSDWVLAGSDGKTLTDEDQLYKRELLAPQRIRHWDLSELRDLATRRYQMQYCALEFFLSDGTSCFVSLRTGKTLQQLCRTIKRLMPIDFAPLLYLSPTERLRRTGATEAWLKRRITTFEYLMIVNKMAGRTCIDLGQYPIFPWVLQDYESDNIDLSNPKSYRDLTKPMGAQTEEREQLFRKKYDRWDPQVAGDMPVAYGPAFHYFMHYSSPAAVISYLVRVEPFTSYQVDLQANQFDKPDRQIQSIAQTYWGCAFDASGDADVKELIPEYFYNPDVLVNTNRIDFGTTSKNVRLGDIVLPPWANGSPEEFIRIQRAALESEHVSANLHHWIDLIFGIKQRPPFLDDGSNLAVDACNVFQHHFYEGAIDMDILKKTRPHLFDMVTSRYKNFGQTPPQVFHRGHPKRPPLSEPIFPLFSDVPGLERRATTTVARRQQKHRSGSFSSSTSSRLAESSTHSSPSRSSKRGTTPNGSPPRGSPSRGSPSCNLCHQSIAYSFLLHLSVGLVI